MYTSIKRLLRYFATNIAICVFKKCIIDALYSLYVYFCRRSWQWNIVVATRITRLCLSVQRAGPSHNALQHYLQCLDLRDTPHPPDRTRGTASRTGILPAPSPGAWVVWGDMSLAFAREDFLVLKIRVLIRGWRIKIPEGHYKSWRTATHIIMGTETLIRKNLIKIFISRKFYSISNEMQCWYIFIEKKVSHILNFLVIDIHISQSWELLV